MLKLGIVGWGAIGGGVGERVMAGATPEARLSAILRRSGDSVNIDGPVVCRDLEQMLAQDLDAVLEAAGTTCLHDIAEPVLSAGVDLIVMSTGALAEDAFRERAVAAARSGCARLLVPAGAMAGLDAVSAATFGGIDRIEAAQKKPPAALLPADEAAQVEIARELGAYSPREAGRNFPRNANVLVGLGLAAGDLDGPRLSIVADPGVSRNQVSYRVEGAFGRLEVHLESEPSANRRTSQLAIYSALGAIRRLSEPLVVGA